MYDPFLSTLSVNFLLGVVQLEPGSLLHRGGGEVTLYILFIFYIIMPLFCLLYLQNIQRPKITAKANKNSDGNPSPDKGLKI